MNNDIRFARVIISLHTFRCYAAIYISLLMEVQQLMSTHHGIDNAYEDDTKNKPPCHIPTIL